MLDRRQFLKALAGTGLALMLDPFNLSNKSKAHAQEEAEELRLFKPEKENYKYLYDTNITLTKMWENLSYQELEEYAQELLDAAVLLGFLFTTKPLWEMMSVSDLGKVMDQLATPIRQFHEQRINLSVTEFENAVVRLTNNADFEACYERLGAERVPRPIYSMYEKMDHDLYEVKDYMEHGTSKERLLEKIQRVREDVAASKDILHLLKTFIGSDPMPLVERSIREVLTDNIFEAYPHALDTIDGIAQNDIAYINRDLNAFLDPYLPDVGVKPEDIREGLSELGDPPYLYSTDPETYRAAPVYEGEFNRPGLLECGMTEYYIHPFGKIAENEMDCIVVTAIIYKFDSFEGAERYYNGCFGDEEGRELPGGGMEYEPHEGYNMTGETFDERHEIGNLGDKAFDYESYDEDYGRRLYDLYVLQNNIVIQIFEECYDMYTEYLYDRGDLKELAGKIDQRILEGS